MTTPYPTDEAVPAPTALNVIGWLLIGAAFFAAGWSGIQSGNFFHAAQRVGQLFGSGLIIFLLAWLATRNGAPATRAYGRIVVGILLWLIVAFNITTDASEKIIGQGFLRDAIAMNQLHTQKFQVLNERFAHADLSDVLTNASITSAAGIARGRKQVAQFRALVAARDALLRQNLDDVGRLVANLPAGPTKEGAAATVSKRRAETMRVFKNLTKTQLVQLDLVDRILDWSAAQGSKLNMAGGQLQYASQEQASELQDLLDELTAAETAANKAFETASKMEQSAEDRKVESLKRAAELLK